MFISTLLVQQFRYSNQSLPSVIIHRGSPRRMSQRCHIFSFAFHAQTSEDTKKLTPSRERAENFLQNGFVSEKNMKNCGHSDLIVFKSSKAL